MEEFFSNLLVRAIPWLLPMFLVASWMYGTKSSKSSGKSDDASASKTTKKDTPVKKSEPARTEQAEMSADVSDSDMTE